MKYNIGILLFFLYQFTFSQSGQMIVEYDLIVYNDATRASNNYLYIAENRSIFLLYGKAGTNLPFEEISTDYKDSKIGNFLEYLPDNSFHFTGYMTPPKRILAFDKAPEIKWKLQEDYREILNYRCQKATGEFRGRKWIVYFTKEIPSRLGPWKLIGLPGLILQAYTEDSDFNYLARRIVSNSSMEMPTEIYKFIEKLKPTLIDYKTYISKENEFLKNQISQQLASMPAGSSTNHNPLRFSQPEKLFEWEKEPAMP